jgi:hypothetical protein
VLTDFFLERIHMKILVGYDGSNAALAAIEPETVR